MAFTHALSTNNYGPAKLIVATSAANGTHTTLAGAMADAVSGDTIFLRDSVTENVTLTAGVNIAAWTGGSLNTPSITGTLTMTSAGTCNISGIRLVTNSAVVLAVTGSAASIVNLNNCYLNLTNNSGITFSSSSGSSAINISNCTGDLGTTGIILFAHSASGALTITNTFFTNTGSSTTASTCSAGIFNASNCQFLNPITMSSTAASTWEYCAFITQTNTTAVTLNGGSASCKWCRFQSGSASAVSIGSSTTFFQLCEIESSNTNAITGAGTITYSGMSFGSTSNTINTTTQTGSGTLQGSKNTAPAAGYLGERITSGSITGVSLTDSTAKTIASITLTPGVWDITAFGGTQYSAFVGTSLILSISTTTNTLQGAQGDQEYYFASTGVGVAVGYTGSVPAFRVVISSNTTYYAVIQTNFASGTCTGLARISAVRVG